MTRLNDDQKARFLCLVIAYVLFAVCVSWQVAGVLLACNLLAAALVGPSSIR